MKNGVLFVVLLLCLSACGCNKHKRTPESAFAELGHLTTLRCEFTMVSDPGEGKNKNLVLREMPGHVLLSFDLLKAKIERSGNELTFTLPEIEPLSPELDYRESKDYKDGKWVFSSNTAYNKQIDEDDKKMVAKMCELAKDPALVKIARNQAEILIKTFYAENFPELDVLVKFADHSPDSAATVKQ